MERAAVVLGGALRGSDQAGSPSILSREEFMQPLEADFELWAPTWDHSTQRRVRGDVPYFNRRTGALEFARRDWEPSTGQNSPSEDVILSWPKADREQVSLFADEKAAKAWLRERGFAVKWTQGPP